MGVLNARLAAVASIGLLTSGCATTNFRAGGPCSEGKSIVAPLGLGSVMSQRYNSVCGQTMAANSMIASGDPGLQAVGQLTLEGLDPAAKANGDRVRDALVNTRTTEYTASRNADGSYTLRGAPVVTVPKAERSPVPQP